MWKCYRKGRTKKLIAKTESFDRLKQDDFRRVRPYKTLLGIPLYADNSALRDYISHSEGSFDETLDNLYGAGEHIDIRIVTSKLNCENLPSLAKIIAERYHYCRHVCLMGLEMMGNAMINRDKVWCSYGELWPYVYHDKDEYISEFQYDMAGMKYCLLSATQLVILMLTDSCNQRCVYCQAGGAHTSKMSAETCRKAVNLAVQSPVSHITIEFQGGEPAMNPEALRFMIPYARKVFAEHGKSVGFALASNITHVDAELLRWIIEQDVNISTSLDGNRTLHEYNRPLAVNESSYDAWHEGVELYRKLCAECGKNPALSAIQTTTRKSLSCPGEIIDEYISDEMNQLYVRPLTPLGRARKNWNIIGYSPEEYIKFYCHLMDCMMKKCRDGVYVSEAAASIYLKRILNGESVGHTEFRSPRGAATGQIAVNYDGNIYTCDEGRMLANMGDDIFRLGSVDNTYRELMKSPVAHAVCTSSCAEALPMCCACVYLPYCSVCPAVNYGLEGDLIQRDGHSYRCVIAKGILDYLFTVIQKNNSEEMKILRQWANS